MVRPMGEANDFDLSYLIHAEARRDNEYYCAGSSNGRTPGSGPGNLGSSPSPAVILLNHPFWVPYT